MPSCACYIEKVEVDLFFWRHFVDVLSELREVERRIFLCLYEAIVGPHLIREEVIAVDSRDSRRTSKSGRL
jgi:hypothetical protein